MEEQVEQVAGPCSAQGGFSEEFWGRALRRVTDEVPDTGDGGGSLHDGQQHGRDGELFSSEVVSSLASAQLRSACLQ